MATATKKKTTTTAPKVEPKTEVKAEPIKEEVVKPAVIE